MKTFVCHHTSDLKAPAQAIIELLKNYPVCLLYGEMGAGKTTLTVEICKILGIESPVSSPTFTIINEYSGNKSRLIHVDLYRIIGQTELFNTGLEEYLYNDDPCIIEWPEVALSMIPLPYLKVEIKATTQDTREIDIEIIDK
ncbi:MAG: tRNA (adenosine(37)-N6)-threonylcarbamoyltransferase complex ATPase subunit type 1 TsaE [Bacteroidetes bacterium HGW-Bacteroidetes-21]|jgi:tRNA threonylcarbamoyladenosine biosynthesis protein TsaE|nr:MAG: tRNA (adenosine(37)-N6)-threonylcarbamoyltransferase complex ATPase subunit type 1 TsaE [Bacteroidetes bacterium HGW-Bacteroidetes-21]